MSEQSVKTFSWDDINDRVQVGTLPRVTARDWGAFVSVVMEGLLFLGLEILGALVVWHALRHALGMGWSLRDVMREIRVRI